MGRVPYGGSRVVTPSASLLPVSLLLLLSVMATAPLGCRRAVAPEALDGGRLGRVLLFRPGRLVAGVVVLFSDRAGWSSEDETAARALQRRGAAVIGVDLPRYVAGLAQGDVAAQCHYVVTDIEGLAKQVERLLATDGYLAPLLAGVGEGGTLAYAVLSQAPAATVAGAVSIDPAPVLATKLPLCAGAPFSAAADGFTYGAASELPGAWSVSTREPLSPELARLATSSPSPGGEPPSERLVALVATALDEIRPAPGPLRGLPLVELPSVSPGPWLAVIYSGDGGWRDLDKTIGEILARQGTPVVGVDSLRYFWRAKTPEQVASDLAALIAHYGNRWGTRRVVLVGYSFGAGIVPFAVNRLPEAQRATVGQLSLLGLGERAPFEFRLSGWLDTLGGDPYADAPLVLPELEHIDPAMIQCFYGEDETDSLCRSPALAGVERIVTAGGHHFDGDYPALARRILDGLRRRGGDDAK